MKKVALATLLFASPFTSHAMSPCSNKIDKKEFQKGQSAQMQWIFENFDPFHNNHSVNHRKDIILKANRYLEQEDVLRMTKKDLLVFQTFTQSLGLPRKLSKNIFKIKCFEKKHGPLFTHKSKDGCLLTCSVTTGL